MVLSRSRWANVLVALAMVFSAAVGGALVSGVDLAGAGPSSGIRPVTETIAPCRIMETRASEGSVGPQATAVTAGQTVTLPVTGAIGKGGCTPGPGLVGAVLNITAVNATADTFLTAYPCDVLPRPTASTLNPFPNRITFNSAVVDLSAAGTVCIFNNAGSVDVVVDVTGILYDHNHNDLYYTEGEINSRYMFATVNANGTLRRGTTGVTSQLFAGGFTGDYTVTFPSNISNCGWVASTTATSDGNNPVIGEVGLSLDGTSALYVQGNNSAGTDTEVPYNIVVVC